MQVFQTAGVPPRCGRIILPIIGCTMNKRVALTKSEIAKYRSKVHLRADRNRSWPGCIRHFMNALQAGHAELMKIADAPSFPGSAWERTTARLLPRRSISA